MAENLNTIDVIPLIQDSQLIELKVIGTGGFGQVVLCNYRRNNELIPRKVVKKQLLRGGIPERDIKYLQNEAKIMWRLNSPYVISMVGLNFSETQFSIVMEYAENESCANFFRTLSYNDLSSDTTIKLWPLKARIAYQVIQGMVYLHGIQPRRILHLDLKSQNVLLEQNLNVKLCDFGLSQMHTLSALSRTLSIQAVTANDKKDGRIRGTISHIAPEHLKDPNRKPTVKSDSYSYGIFLWELLTNEQPYHRKNTLALT
ncbi:receptor-interacting serine/threonine-protein kinase 1-like [Ciona intestinalis]